MASFESEVLDVGGTRLAHPQAVQAEEDGERGVSVVDAFGGEQERSGLRPIKAASIGGVDPGCGTYWAGLEAIRPSMWANR